MPDILRERPNGPERGLGARLFTFAVVADTHVNQEENKASSDFAVNGLANARNRHVIHEINKAAPAFVLHLGDIVHPTPRHPHYAVAAGAFQALAAKLKSPLYLTPGNHDVGDKPGDWLPVPSVSDEFLALYERHFGAHYYSFDSNGCHFTVIDAQIINSGLACEETQRAWLEQDLMANAGRRTFLCTHYPPYLFDPAEEGHYDNIDEPGRSWLLGLLQRGNVEALFAGHVHNFWYHLHGDTDMYLLPSTAFVRLDYSELYRIEPGPERGRNDAPKLGFMLVDVHENGHVAHTLRTYGATLAPGGAADASKRLPPIHTRTIRRAPVGLDLRYPWVETVEVVASGALDEFARKPARTDYPLMALWEMGVRRLRVPAMDVANPATRERMRALRRMGHEFTVYTHGVPSGAVRDALIKHCDLVAAWEVIATWRGRNETIEQVRKMTAAAPLAAYLSKLRRPDEPHHHGQRARHVIEHGFLLQEAPQIQEFFAIGGAREAFDGVLFRVSREQAPWDDLPRVEGVARDLGIRARAYVRLAAENPAEAMEDDLANANRVAETIVVTLGCADVTVWLDTFNDVDRGYFPRSGLVDRRYNPRMAARVYRNLHAAFDGQPSLLKLDALLTAGDVGVAVARTERALWLLLMPRKPTSVGYLPLAAETALLANAGTWINLADGVVSEFAVSIEKVGGVSHCRLSHPVACDAPALIRLGW